MALPRKAKQLPVIQAAGPGNGGGCGTGCGCH
jgi:hypothetical protein